MGYCWKWNYINNINYLSPNHTYVFSIFLKLKMKKLLYVPNIIGFIRVFLLLASTYYSLIPSVFTPLYFLNFCFDGLDGFAARLFKQETRFGYALDMITDRISSALLFILLIEKSFQWRFFFICCLFFDISSHWFATLQSKTHKIQKNYLLKWYYKPQNLFITCVCNELFLLSLYHFNFLVYSNLQWFIQFLLCGFFLLKTTISIVQLFESCQLILINEN